MGEAGGVEAAGTSHVPHTSACYESVLKYQLEFYRDQEDTLLMFTTDAEILSITSEMKIDVVTHLP